MTDMDKFILPGSRKGCVAAPASKSHAHRLLLCAALSEGENEVEYGSLSNDISATLACLRAMGACEESAEGSSLFRGSILDAGHPASVCLPCGESGSTLRFLLPLCGALGLKAEFRQEGRLPERPLEPLCGVLCSHGMSVVRNGSSVYCEGQLRPGDYSITGSVSSQFITGLLYALPLLDGNSRLTVTGRVESEGYIAMTEDALLQSGIRFEKQGWQYHTEGRQRYRLPRHCRLEGDCSNAAFFLVMGAFSRNGITVDNIPAHSLQGDREIIRLLRRFGAELTEDGERVTVRSAPLRGIATDVSQIPDLVPALAVLAAGAEGETRFENAARLRLKESDRLHALSVLLSSLGGEVRETDDTLIIRGGRPLSGGAVDTARDHRIAMAAAAAAPLCRSGVTVCGAECTDKSFPGFWNAYSSLELET